MNMSIRLTQGPPVKGDDFFDRKDVIGEIWDSLERSSILLTAPRRFGKTSIMFHLRDNPTNGFTPFFFDVEHVESPDEFILELIEETHKKGKFREKVKSGIHSFFKAAGERIEEIEISQIRVKLRESEEIDWKALGKHLIEIIAKSEKKLLLILDEFPEMIKLMIDRDRELGTNQTKVFLGWFRNIRQTMPENVKLRFIIGGSICLENLLRQIQCISKINDMDRIKIGPFSSEESLRFIRELFSGEGEETDESIPKTIEEQIGTPIPYFIQIMVMALLRESRNLKREITLDFVKDVYESYLLGTDYKSYFDHYYLRLSEYYSSIGGERDMLKAAKAILTEISIIDTVPKHESYQRYLDETHQTSDEDGFVELMSLLEDEFYLEYHPESESYRFFSKLLKDWWYRHYGMLKDTREAM